MTRTTPIAALAVIGSFAAATATRAEIVELKLDTPEIFADGKAFGPAGGYVRITGVARGELDPKDARNSPIADIDKAPVNARGKVDYETDVFILRPADQAKGSGVVVYDVLNRGRKLFFGFFSDANAPGIQSSDPRTAADVGNGFPLDRGHTLVWSGWDPDAPKAGGGMTIRVPIARDGGKWWGVGVCRLLIGVDHMTGRTPAFGEIGAMIGIGGRCARSSYPGDGEDQDLNMSR